MPQIELENVLEGLIRPGEKLIRTINNNLG